MASPVYNLVVACSNIFGLPVILAATIFQDQLLVSMVVLASVLMHLSERKHDLPGVHPFSRWNSAFLNLDRVVAVLVFVACLNRITLDLVTKNISVILVGIASVIISETVEVCPVFFSAWHILWHACVYRMLYVLVSQQ